MDFSSALNALKGGFKVSRSGWNGTGMYVYLVPENRYAPTTDAGRKIAAKHEDGNVPYRAYFALKTAEEDVATWVPSSSDLLAADWELV